MPATFDVAVIGGGIAGVSAALAARARGASVCIVRAAPGATAMMNGAWTGPLPDGVRAALAEAGFVLVPVTLPMAHQRGDVVTADYAGQTHIAAVPAAETLVCGIAGLPHFNAHALARLWSKDAPLRAHTIELPGTPAGGWAVASLAAFIERDPQVLLRALGQHATQRIIIAAVLGVTDAGAVQHALHEQSGILFSEALAVPPSLPGWRLQRAIDRVLSIHDITLFAGRAAALQGPSERIDALRIGDTVVHARAFVLATGKFVAGGLTTRDGFQESVFDLPIWLEQLGDVYTAPDPLPLTDPVRTEPQPLLEAGVRTDGAARPVDRAQQVIYHNVFAAGSIRSGWSAAGSGLGHCALDGWSAGERASA